MGCKPPELSSACLYRKYVLCLGASSLPFLAELSRMFSASSSRRGDIAHDDVTHGDRLPASCIRLVPIIQTATPSVAQGCLLHCQTGACPKSYQAIIMTLLTFHGQSSLRQRRSRTIPHTVDCTHPQPGLSYPTVRPVAHLQLPLRTCSTISPVGKA